MTVLICPVCGSPLKKGERACFCENHHTFDLSAGGYVHLLPAGQMKSKIPGDNKEMVTARSMFLNDGFYAPLADKLSTLFLSYAKDTIAWLDAGCGEGYYTQKIVSALEETCSRVTAVGVDISKFAIARASKRTKAVQFVVGSVYHLPVADNTMDMVLNVFSPLCVGEYWRVLKPGGLYFYVVPGKRHLWQMKEVLYETPYENARMECQYDGFVNEGVHSLSYTAALQNSSQLQAMFTMTPYFWKTSRKGADRLREKGHLTTEIAFDIHVLRKSD